MDTFVGHQTNIDNISISAIMHRDHSLSTNFAVYDHLHFETKQTLLYHLFDACFDISVWFCRRRQWQK
jgi:hypothetical protein